MEWYKVESTEMPSELDFTSSKKYNYVHRNVRKVECTSDEGDTITVYEYEELKVPKEAWSMYEETAQNTADIEYIAAITDIDLEV